MESQMPTLGVTVAYSGSHGGLLRESQRPTQRVRHGVTVAYSGSHGCLLRGSQKPTQGVTEADSGSHSGPTQGVTVARLRE